MGNWWRNPWMEWNTSRMADRNIGRILFLDNDNLQNRGELAFINWYQNGILIGYALKKVIKIVAVIVGLFLAGLAYLQYHQIANINWNKLQTVLSDGAITTLSNAITQIPGIINSGDSSHAAATASSLAMTSFGIPLTGSMSSGFTIGFIKG
jgi:uncharacterized membrane protein (Fun14 family)